MAWLYKLEEEAQNSLGDFYTLAEACLLVRCYCRQALRVIVG